MLCSNYLGLNVSGIIKYAFYGDICYIKWLCEYQEEKKRNDVFIYMDWDKQFKKK